MESAWPEVTDAVAAAPYPVAVLPVDVDRAAAELRALEITTGSWLGAVVANSGGLTLDHGWLRVLGSGHGRLPSVVERLRTGGGLVVAHDVLGGRFGWWQGEQGGTPTIHYFSPDGLDWMDLEIGYRQWLHAALTGLLTRFYEELRWPGWETEVATLELDQGIAIWPPPWTTEGRDLSLTSRRPVPLAEIESLSEEFSRRIGPGTDFTVTFE
jgi:hypothetical protein